MGHRISRKRRPRRGSMQFWPRTRSHRTHARVRNYPYSKENIPLLFAGYKAGMTHAIIKDIQKGSPTFGQEIFIPVTIIECPPMKILGVRFYSSKKLISDFIFKTNEKSLKMAINIPKKDKNFDEFLKQNEGKFDDLKILFYTQPKLIGFKRKPQLIETALGGNFEQKLAYVKENLDKEIKISNIFKEKEFVDICSITKGKGFQGSVKRFGLKLLPGKGAKNRRKAGTLGSWHPAKTQHTVPQHGQLGYFTRVEYNKQIIKMGNGFTLKGGIKHYGNVKNDYILLKGSVAGSTNRLIKIRKAIRKISMDKSIELVEVSVGNKQ